jgi:hypothetical protein
LIKKYKPQIINAINYIIAQQNEEGFGKVDIMADIMVLLFV